jgi:P-type Ca2+ transporter type 2C
VHFIVWIEGFSTLVGLGILALLSAFFEYKSQKTIFEQNEIGEEIKKIKIMRDEILFVEKEVNLVVGDIVKLEAGKEISGDGILVWGRNVFCDQSMLTGESTLAEKVKYEEALERTESIQTGPAMEDFSPILLSGSKVIEGEGYYLTLAVGIRTTEAKFLTLPASNIDFSQLELQLENLAAKIAKVIQMMC